MIDKSGRYAQAAEAELVRPDGSTVRHVVPPILPHPDSYVVAQVHLVTDSDRPDTLAARHYGQATAWWLIANANDAGHPDQLADTPGDGCRIPVPDGVGGRG